MTCPYAKNCGGCPYRNLTETDYQKFKQDLFLQQLSALKKQPEAYDEAVFIADGQRRRASLAFFSRKQQVILGFNKNKSNEIVDIEKCELLTPKLNDILPSLRNMLKKLVSVPFKEKIKNHQYKASYLKEGDIWLSEVDNGLDIVLEFNKTPELEHRLIISDFAMSNDTIIRVSHRLTNNSSNEVIIEKTPPYTSIKGINVYIPAGTFLQASKSAETALIDIVMIYLGKTEGKIADLFCGVGTFSYPMSQNKKNKIQSIDSSSELLDAFSKTVHKNQISNIEIAKKNLFKYPLSGKELEDYEAMVFDPPRAGAMAQIKKIAELEDKQKPKKIIAVSCNPETFVNDANCLLSSGYILKKVTMVDQFIYSKHLELVALFVRSKA